MLQVSRGTTTFVSDFFDISIYVDADGRRRPPLVRRAVPHPARHRVPAARLLLPRYAELSDEDATATALEIWRDINERNLIANIEPTRERADVVLRKGADHRVDEVRLRRI